MHTSDNGIYLIQKCEGFSAKVYNDVGHPAIGYGHDLQPGESFPDGITADDALDLLRHDLATRYEPSINALVPASCTQNQFDALASFAYNLGVGALKTMLVHGWDEVPTQIPRWNHVNGTESDALSARRAKEVELFNT